MRTLAERTVCDHLRHAHSLIMRGSLRGVSLKESSCSGFCDMFNFFGMCKNHFLRVVKSVLLMLLVRPPMYSCKELLSRSNFS